MWCGRYGERRVALRRFLSPAPLSFRPVEAPGGGGGGGPVGAGERVRRPPHPLRPARCRRNVLAESLLVHFHRSGLLSFFFIFAIPENLFFLINVCLLRFFPLFSGRYLFEEHSHRLNLKLVITNFSGKKNSPAVFHIIYQAGNRFSSKKLVSSNDSCKISFFTCCRVEILFII